jgi:hypothetical protein
VHGRERSWSPVAALPFEVCAPSSSAYCAVISPPHAIVAVFQWGWLKDLIGVA